MTRAMQTQRPQTPAVREGDVLDRVSDAALPLGDGRAIQRVQGTYTTAITVQKPRDLKMVEARVLAEADLLGELAFYGWGNGKDRVEGPSIDLAACLARNWGNCVIELLPVQETADAWIFTASFVDLETGYTRQRQFRQSKNWVVYGKFDQARKDDIRFQIGQSKAERNVILKAVPAWLVDRALDRAKKNVKSQMEARIAKDGQERVAEACVNRLEELGVVRARVLYTMGRRVAAALTLEDLVLLAANIKALEIGADTIDALFPEQPVEPKVADTASKLEDAKKVGEDAQRIAEEQARAYEQRVADSKTQAQQQPASLLDPADAFENEREKGF